MEALIDLNKSSDYVNLQLKDKTWQIKIIGTPEDPYFCGKDVCEILKYDNIKKALQNNVRPKHKKMLSEFSGEIGERNGAFGHSHVQDLTYHTGKAIYINEPGLYMLIMKSKAPFAEAFQDLVCEKILPSIRKYGTYVLEQQLQKSFEQLSLKDQAIAKLQKEQVVFNAFIHKVTLRQKNEWIYIATTKQYAKQKIFKIGSTEKLSKRIQGYQTGRVSQDNMYYCWTYQVYDSKKIDSLIKHALGDFREKNEAEMYQLHFPDLVDLVQKACDEHNDYIDYVNDFKHHRLKFSLMEEPIEILPVYKPATPTLSIRKEVMSIQDKLKLVFQTIDDIKAKGKDSVTRKELLQSINEKKKTWAVIKDKLNWKDSKTPIDGIKIIY